MKTFGLIGASGSGKTTLLCRLLPVLAERGYQVSTIKHTHHGFDMDRPGKDSWRHREAGAKETLILSAQRWVLQHELRDRPEPSMEAVIERMQPVDLILVEGFKTHPFPKIEVHRRANNRAMVGENDASVVGLVSDGSHPDLSIPQFHLDDIPAIADFIVAQSGLDRP